MAKEKKDQIGNSTAVVYPMRFPLFHDQKEIMGLSAYGCRRPCLRRTSPIGRFHSTAKLGKELVILPSILLATWSGLALAQPASRPATASPYTVIEATADMFRCLGREIKLGSMLLPEQVVSASQPLLAGGVCILAEPAALEMLKGRATLLENNGDRARWEWKGESTGMQVHAQLAADCDGFCWYEITLAPKQPLKLGSLRLEIPRLVATARYLHTANFTWGRVSRGLMELGGRWHDSFMPYIWLGDEERGLAWCCESDEGWRLNSPSKALQVETSDATVTFRITLLDHEDTVDSPVTLRFGLQASPVKPVSFEWRAKARIMHNVRYESMAPDKTGRVPLDTMRDAGVRTVVFHDEWTDYFGKVSTPYDQQLRQLIAACHQRGLKLLVYIGYGLARKAPELQGRHQEWSTLPLIPWETSYKPDNRNFDACCPRSGWGDWLVAGIDKLFSDYDLDGLYFDGTSEAWRCQNTAHGCGWRDADGKMHETYPLLAARQMMRRIAETVRRHHPDAILDVHMSGNLTLPTLSFATSYWDGEQFEGRTAKDNFEVPLHMFRTEFMGYAQGLDAEFLCYVDRPFSFNEAIALAWLHGVEVRPYPDTLEFVAPIWEAMDRFGAASAKWQPYWKGSGVQCADENVKTSAYVGQGKVLLFVSHLKREPLKTVLTIDRGKLDLGAKPLSARDAITNKPIELQVDSLTLTFDGMTYRIVELTPQ